MSATLERYYLLLQEIQRITLMIIHAIANEHLDEMGNIIIPDIPLMTDTESDTSSLSGDDSD